MPITKLEDVYHGLYVTSTAHLINSFKHEQEEVFSCSPPEPLPKSSIITETWLGEGARTHSELSVQRYLLDGYLTKL